MIPSRTEMTGIVMVSAYTFSDDRFFTKAVSRFVGVLETAHFGSCFQVETAQDPEVRFDRTSRPVPIQYVLYGGCRNPFLLMIIVAGGLRPRARSPGGSVIIIGWSPMSFDMR